MSHSGGICVIAGEASGDAQIAPVIAELRCTLNDAGFRNLPFWGVAGPQMRQLGVEPVVPLENIAVMGFTEIVPAYFRIQKVYNKMLREVECRNPLAVLLVDYPGFNLRFARDVFERGNTVIYHIAPKVWARDWNRVEELRDFTHLVTVILPFEERLLRAEGINAFFVGNPLCDGVRNYRLKNSLSQAVSCGFAENCVRIAVLPGSRKAELQLLLPLFVAALFELEKRLGKNIVAKIPVAPTLSLDFVKRILMTSAGSLGVSADWVAAHVRLETDGVYPVLADADYCWVCSGTAALETAFFEVPNSVAYRMSWPSAVLMKLLMNIRWVSLSNLCGGREIVPEYLQHRATVENLVSHAHHMLTNSVAREFMRAELRELERLFPNAGANRAAKQMAGTIISNLLPEEQKFKKHIETRGRILSEVLR
jgi:lipid-A-disaccharide synthase